MALQNSIFISTLHVILCRVEGQRVFGIQAKSFFVWKVLFEIPKGPQMYFYN